MATTYPPPPASVEGDYETIHRFLKSPAQIARRLQRLSDRRYISDFLLTQRLRVEGGAVRYESGEELGTNAAPRAVAPGGEYPLVTIGGGASNLASTDKWGQDALVTDESIKRQRMNPVNRAFTKLVNQNVMTVDALSMSAIASAMVTHGATREATAPWNQESTSAEQILRDVLLARADLVTLEMGLDADAVVLDDEIYAWVKAKFIAAGYLPREAGNPVNTNSTIQVEGLTWAPTSHGFSGQVGVFDRSQLGGMADEDLGGPGYAKATEAGAPGVEVKSIRDDDNDQYKVRARRVTVPVVLEPLAGRLITAVRAG